MNCLHCKRTAVCRGLCMSCYGQARLKVLEGSTTWKQLQQAKLSLPPVYNVGGFNIAFKEAKTARKLR